MDGKKVGEELSFFEGVRRILKSELERRKKERGALISDLIVFSIALFFARRNLIFGAYPLALAFIATLPSRVWIALFGAVFGSLTLGYVGVINAIISVIAVFMRLIISGGRKRDEADESLFSEPYIMRLAAGSISAFIGGVYTVLYEGFSLSSILSASFGVVFTAALGIAYFGIYLFDVSCEDIIYGTRNLFARGLGKEEKYARWLYQTSFLIFSFLIGFATRDYVFFGISLSYVFSSGITLFVARRFGAVRAMAVGFVSSLAVSSSGAVAFALAGLGAGALFGIGFGYALVGAAALVALWCAYSGGLSSFLAIFPEYAVSSLLLAPFLRGAGREKSGEESSDSELVAMNMVKVKAQRSFALGAAFSSLEEGLLRAAVAIRDYSDGEGVGEFSEYRNIAIALTSSFDPPPSEEKINILAIRLSKRRRISESEACALFPGCADAARFISELYRVVGEYELECYENRRMGALSSEYELISKMINEARVRSAREAAINPSLTETAEQIFASAGFPDGVIKAYGERRLCFIGAGEDSDGSLITDSRLKRALEEAAERRLGSFDFFRKGNMALFEARCAPMWQVEWGSASYPASGAEASGDTAAGFEAADYFYSLISDGMGSGEIARKTSFFVSEFLRAALTSEATASTVLSALNHIIRHRGEECSATVDLFSFDMLSGEGFFIKCGAAPSFVKRGNSLFRVRSSSAPLGLMPAVDSERIRVDLLGGDTVIMLSDGAALLPDDAAWLFEYLSKPTELSPSDYAAQILALAKEKSDSRDDITVSVAKILPRRK